MFDKKKSAPRRGKAGGAKDSDTGKQGAKHTNANAQIGKGERVGATADSVAEKVTSPGAPGSGTAGEAALNEALSRLSAKPAGASSANTGAGRQSDDTIFTKPTPSGAAKKISEVLGEIVWLMSQSPPHKQFFISDLEWFVMTPIVLQQFRMFYDETKPIGCVLWGSVNEEVEQRLVSGTPRLRPQEWKSGDRLWVVEVIAPFGGADEMVKDLKAKVFKERELKFLRVGKNGREVKLI